MITYVSRLISAGIKPYDAVKICEDFLREHRGSCEELNEFVTSVERNG